MTKLTIHLIAGPTASGKSALALEIARRERGTVINADAMQAYAGLPILTAQPEPQDKKEIPHELYEVFDPAERSSVGKWLTLAENAIRRAVEASRTPILVGGTGLYFKALLEGLAEIPPVPEDVRNAAQKLYASLGPDAFRAELAKLDPESAAHLKPNDKQRLIRAYEVAKHTGKPIGHWQVASSSTAIAEDFALRSHLLLPPREKLYAACDKRFLNMMERGAIEEVHDLLARKLDPDLPAMKILGVREIAAFLRDEISREEAIAKARQATRNYAKRQVTWFRNQWAMERR
ncbi:MAG: tRNA (adenosine(37)-N6)-dimethylallyltransferase MiaA [Alphaproteobacteria bacterium]|nr:tRNA (adenosine(37)-N6)-dimethylallyltransferase MiaA [Alphaproteobacteria bacterium]